MDRNGAWTLAAVTVVGALLAGCGAGGAAGASGTTSTSGAGSTAATTTAAKAHTCPLQVRITSTGGSTWGSVTATFAGKTQVVSASSGTIAVPCGQTVSLAQKPASSKSWPFSAWRISGDHGHYAGKSMKSSTIHVKVNAATQVRAQYRLAGSAGAATAKVATAKTGTAKATTHAATKGTTAAAAVSTKTSGKAW